MLMCGGLDAQCDIGLTRFNHRRGLAVRLGDSIIAPDLLCIHLQTFEFCIEPQTCA